MYLYNAYECACACMMCGSVCVMCMNEGVLCACLSKYESHLTFCTGVTFFQKCGVDSWRDWRPHLAIILANGICPRAQKVTVQMLASTLGKKWITLVDNCSLVYHIVVHNHLIFFLSCPWCLPEVEGHLWSAHFCCMAIHIEPSYYYIQSLSWYSLDRI